MIQRMTLSEIKQSPQDYQSAQPIINRYHDSKRVWDERIGDARVQAANWRLVALGTIILGIVLAYGLIYQSSKSKIIPYMVRVNSDGSAQVNGPIPDHYQPQQTEIKYFLRQFVQWVRTIPTDPVVFKQNWLTAYSFLRPAAAMKMTGIVGKENPAALIGNETREVNITSILSITNNSYQIRWKETSFAGDGRQKEQVNMSGIFTTQVITPSDEKVLNVNPLGLYIQDFSWGKENN
jgi:type IV secretory pathway TrbF-like protein